MNVAAIVALANALSPFIVVTEEAIVGALKGAGVPEDQVDGDLRLLISEAVVAKSEADKAASGQDPQDEPPV